MAAQRRRGIMARSTIWRGIPRSQNERRVSRLFSTWSTAASFELLDLRAVTREVDGTFGSRDN